MDRLLVLRQQHQRKTLELTRTLVKRLKETISIEQAFLSGGRPYIQSGGTDPATYLHRLSKIAMDESLDKLKKEIKELSKGVGDFETMRMTAAMKKEKYNKIPTLTHQGTSYFEYDFLFASTPESLPTDEKVLTKLDTWDMELREHHMTIADLYTTATSDEAKAKIAASAVKLQELTKNAMTEIDNNQKIDAQKLVREISAILNDAY